MLNTQPDEALLMIETVCGNLVNPSNPHSDAIDINDIGWALSRLPRFCGHTVTEVVYNVAQHSIYVCELLEFFLNNIDAFDKVGGSLPATSNPRYFCDYSAMQKKSFLLKALLHDAHEAYIGDIPSPVKRIPELRATVKLIEAKLDKAIFDRFSLEETTENEKILIKFCDNMAQAIEGYQFMPSRGRGWELPKPTLTMLQNFPSPLPPLESYARFISKFVELEQ